MKTWKWIRAPRASALCALLLALTGLPAQAAVRCVSTGTELDAAIDDANAGDEGSTWDIRLEASADIYQWAPGLTFNPAGDRDNKAFMLRGGWNAGCTSRTINPGNTVIAATGGINGTDFFFQGNNRSYLVEGIRFQNFRAFDIDDGLCAPFNICPGTESVIVRNNEFRSAHFVGVGTYDVPVIQISNNLIAGLSGTGPMVHFASLSGNNVLDVRFNTFAALTCLDAGYEAVNVYANGSGSVFHHNIIQSSGCDADIDVDDAVFHQPWRLVNNLYAVRTGFAPAAGSSNPLVGLAPNFVDAAAGNFRLLETGFSSPAINAGSTTPESVAAGLTIPAQDLDGVGGRVVGSRADLGAYESSINDVTERIVSNANDSGTGSLRWAIESANLGLGSQLVKFNIPGNCPRVIALQSPLPDVTDSIEIDGYTQPGASANSQQAGSNAEICVVVLAQSGTLAHALRVPSGGSSNVSLAVKGIAFAGTTGFNGNFGLALNLRSGSNHLVQGNAFGGIGPGSLGSLGMLQNGLAIRGTAVNVLVGGPEPEQRNSFGGNELNAIALNDATSSMHTIQNNYIGLSASGVLPAPITLSGISASNSPGLRILDNVIAASGTGIFISGASAIGYVIARNRIGMSAVGIPTAAFSNGTGITINNGSGEHLIGSEASNATSNVIVGSDGAGVWLTASAGNNITVRGNQIFNNGLGGLGLGIDLGVLGPLVNDPGDVDAGPNRGQNAPVITNSTVNGGARDVTGVINGKLGDSYRMDFFRAPDCAAGNGGGNLYTHVGSMAFFAGVNGDAPFDLQVAGGAPGWLSVIATNLSTGDTSEVSACFKEDPALFKDGFD